MPRPSEDEYPLTDYWPFTQMGAWNPSKYSLLIKEFAKMDGKPYDKTNKIELMKNLENVGFYTPTKELNEKEFEEKWGKYVTLIYYLGIGDTRGGKFKLSGVSKYFLRTNDIVEFIKTQMLRFQYPHGSLQKGEIKFLLRKKKQILPLVFTLQILDKLGSIDLSETYISKGELLFIVEKAKNHSELEIIVSKILENRRNNIVYDFNILPRKVVDSVNRVFPFFAGTKLCYFNPRDYKRTVFVDQNQLDEIKNIMKSHFKFFKFKKISQWTDYYQREPTIISQKDVQELVSINEEDKAVEQLKKIETQIPENKKRIFNKELLDQLDRNSLGRHKRRIRITDKIKRVRNYTLYEVIKMGKNYVCQLCKKDSFIDKHGNNHVEINHILEYNDKEDGPDRKNNIIVLCPNCHAKLTYANKNDIIEAYKELRERGDITLEQFIELKKDGDITSHQIRLLVEKGIISNREAESILNDS